MARRKTLSAKENVFAAPTSEVPSKAGYVDEISNDRISGWAWDPVFPDEAVAVDILDGNEVALRIVADLYRDDLHGGGLGNGCHGFEVLSPSTIFTKSRQRIRICRTKDGVDLDGNIGWIIRKTAGFDDAAAAFLEQEISHTVEVARTADDLGHPLAILLGALNELINARLALDPDRQSGGREVLHDLPYHANVTGWMRELVNKLQLECKPLMFDIVEQPVVSIIIPVFNNFRTTYNCLETILNHPAETPFEIIIVDDCSTDETMLGSLVFSGSIRIIRNAKNVGFVTGCNAGAAAARGKYLFFLNNDTLVRDGWLDQLVATFENVPKVGIVGSKLFFGDGKLQEAGGIIWRLGDGWNWGRGRDPAEPAFCYLRDADWVSGAALMIPKDLFDELRGFDEYYAPAYYEDTDLAFRVRAKGKRVVVQPASEVVHLEGVSAGTDVAGTGMKRHQLVNHRKFRDRWKDVLARHRFNGQQPALEAEREVKRRAYFIDSTVPTPDQDAGSNAALQHMIALMELGYKVTFLPADNMAQINPYTANLQKLGIECLYTPFYWSVEEVLRKSLVSPDLIYLHRYVNAAKYATMARRYFPKCWILYNVCDLHYLRMEREAELTNDRHLRNEAKVQRKSELAVMQDVDCVVVYSTFEASLLQEANLSLPVRVVPWTVQCRPTQVPFADRNGFAFVGGYQHPPNVDAVLHLCADIMPIVQQTLPAANLYIVGSKPPPEVTSLEGSGTKVLGFVPILSDALNKLRLTAVPLRYGAGIKGKILESFAIGLPAVMSEVAAEGMDLPEELSWLIARSPQEFAEKIVALHEQAELNDRLRQAGLTFIDARYSQRAVLSSLEAALAG